jgi:hypothetical protein
MKVTIFKGGYSVWGGKHDRGGTKSGTLRAQASRPVAVALSLTFGKFNHSVGTQPQGRLWQRPLTGVSISDREQKTGVRL